MGQKVHIDQSSPHYLHMNTLWEGPIRNLETHIRLYYVDHHNHFIMPKHLNIIKWTYSNNLDHHLSNILYPFPIHHPHKSCNAQYTGHYKNLFWFKKFPIPLCRLRGSITHQIDTWLHILARCPHLMIHKLHIDRHNKGLKHIQEALVNLTTHNIIL